LCDAILFFFTLILHDFSYGNSRFYSPPSNVEGNTPFLIKKFGGYLKMDTRTTSSMEVSAMSVDLVMTKSSLFSSLGGVNETYGDELSFADFCLRVGITGNRIMYSPFTTALNFEEEEDIADDNNFSNDYNYGDPSAEEMAFATRYAAYACNLR
jgi:hypothetical protein